MTNICKHCKKQEIPEDAKEEGIFICEDCHAILFTLPQFRQTDGDVIRFVLDLFKQTVKTKLKAAEEELLETEDIDDLRSSVSNYRFYDRVDSDLEDLFHECIADEMITAADDMLFNKDLPYYEQVNTELKEKGYISL